MTGVKIHRFPGSTVQAGPGLPRALVILLEAAAAVVTVAGAKAAAWFLAPTLLALVIVITIAPVHRWLRSHRVPAWAATVALILLVYGAIVGCAAVMTVSLARLATLLPQYASRFDEFVSRLADQVARLGVGAGQVREMANSVDLGKIASYLGSFLAGLAGAMSGIVFLLALLLFISVEAAGFDERMAVITAQRPSAAVALGEFGRRTRRYMGVTTIFGLIVAVLDTVALLVAGIPLALLWGLLSFVTNYIPNVGFILGLVPPALLAWLSGGWQLMVIVIAVYCALNFVVQSLIQPYFVGDAVGLSATMTFLALIFWAWVLGPLGAILAIPVTLLVRTTFIDVDPGAGWIAALFNLSMAGSRDRTRRRPESGQPEGHGDGD